MDTQTQTSTWTPKTKIAFALAVLLQFALIAGMVVQHEMKVRGGTEVVLKTVPVDPRDLLVGNYVRLAYDISSSNPKRSDRQFGYGETVYVTLAPNSFGEWEGVSYSGTRPTSGVYLEGKVTSPDGTWGRWGWMPGAGIEYGIESYFTSPDDALALERSARTGALLVRVSVAEDGSGTVRGLGGILTQEDVIARARKSLEGYERDQERRKILEQVVAYLSRVKAETGAYPQYFDAYAMQGDRARIKMDPEMPASEMAVPIFAPSPYLQQIQYMRCSDSLYHVGIDMETDYPDVISDRAGSGKLCPNDQIDASGEGTCAVYDSGWWDRSRTCVDRVGRGE